MSMKFDPEQRARDFTTGKHPRRNRGRAQPVNQQIAQIRRDLADIREGSFAGGESGGAMVVDQLPDPASSYIGQPVVVRSPAGQPSGAYIGSQDAFDNPVWVPVSSGDPVAAYFVQSFQPDPAPTGFRFLRGIAATPHRVFVPYADGGSVGVLECTHGGVPIGNSTPANFPSDPRGAVYDALNRRIGVCGGNGVPSAKRFQIWNDTFTTRISEIGASGSGDGQFSDIHDIAVDSAGNWYAYEFSNLGYPRVQKFDPSGTFLAKWGAAGSGPGQFISGAGALAITVDSDDNVHVLDWSNHRIQRFSDVGTYQLEYGALGTGPGQMVEPSAVRATSNGLVIIADRGTNTAHVFSNDGAFITRFSLAQAGFSSGRFYRGIAEQNGIVWITDTGGASVDNRVHVWRLAGASDARLVVGSNGSLVSPAARILDFSPDFTAVESPAGEVNIGLANPPLRIYQSADYTGVSNSAAAQKMFNSSSNGAASLEANTTYHLRGVVHIDTTDTDSSNFSVLFGAGGGLTVNWAGFMLEANFTTTETTVAPVRMWATTTAAIALIGAVATAKHLTITWDGHIAITNAGTLIPQYQWGSANQANPKTLRGSWMSFTPVPSTTIGPWS